MGKLNLKHLRIVGCFWGSLEAGKPEIIVPPSTWWLFSPAMLGCPGADGVVHPGPRFC